MREADDAPNSMVLSAKTPLTPKIHSTLVTTEMQLTVARATGAISDKPMTEWFWLMLLSSA